MYGTVHKVEDTCGTFCATRNRFGDFLQRGSGAVGFSPPEDVGGLKRAAPLLQLANQLL
jgi:hypothetical protein